VLIENLEVIGGAWAYSIPISFFPDYSKHLKGEKREKDTLAYNFTYELKILSG